MGEAEATEEAQRALRRLRIWGAYLANIATGDVGLAGEEFLAALQDAQKAIHRDTSGRARRLLPAIDLMRETFVANRGKPASHQLVDELEEALDRAARLLRLPA